jgi:hypothetical protein
MGWCRSHGDSPQSNPLLHQAQDQHQPDQEQQQPFLVDWFCTCFARVRDALVAEQPNLKGIQYRDLRRTGILTLFKLGVRLDQIAAVSGNSIAYCAQLQRTYLPINPEEATAAVVRLEDFLSREGHNNDSIKPVPVIKSLTD